MKKTLLIMVMALAVLLTQCRKPEVKFPSPVAPEGTTVSMTVTAGPGSKTDITPAGGITWSTGDKLYVGDGTHYVGYLTIVSGQNTPTGTFSGDVMLPTGTTVEKTFHFFYLGSAERTLTVGDETVDVDFSSQNIYAEDGKLKNASAQHVGYGSAKGTVKDGIVTGINVTLVSKVALARFSFTDGTTPYSGALTLSGTGIYNKMTVNFNSTGFACEGTKGDISLTNTITSEKYVMLVPTSSTTGSQTLNFGGGALGATTLENGIEANKFYGRESAIAVTLHEYVDLGLPSGLLWATCNLGASKPEEYGDYYAWGEIEPYHADGYSQENPCTHWREDMTTGAGNTDLTSGYAWKSYSQGGASSFAEWTRKPYGSDKILTSDYDAATKAWGGGWRMPTEADCTELIGNTDWSWTTESGVNGLKCANKSDATKYIFLPANGYRMGSSRNLAGEVGYYWSRTRSTDNETCGRGMDCEERTRYMYNWHRWTGAALRPVRGGATPEPPATPKFTVDEYGTKVEFAPGNLYYDGSAFRFEENQWDFRHYYGKNFDAAVIGGVSTTTPAGTVGSFFWSKTASVAYAEDYSGSGASTSDVFFTEASGFQVNGYEANTWRALSIDEWNHLLGFDPIADEQTDDYGRHNAMNLCAWKELDGGTHNGFVILPDDTDASVMERITSTSHLATYGAVFLPAAGYRDGDDVNSVGKTCYSWSSTSNDDDEGEAYDMYINLGYVYPSYEDRNFGEAVRLVRLVR